MPFASRFCDAEPDRPVGGVRGGARLERLPADHRRDDALVGHLVAGQLRDELAVAQDVDPVRELEDLLEPVADVDDAHALTGERLEHRQELEHLGIVHRRGGLVDEHDLGPGAETAGDLDERPLDDRQVADGRIEVDAADPEPVETAVDLTAGGAPVEEDAELRRPLAEQHVIEHAHVGADEELLRDEPDTGLHRLGRTVAQEPVALDRHAFRRRARRDPRRRRRAWTCRRRSRPRRPEPHLRGR